LAGAAAGFCFFTTATDLLLDETLGAGAITFFATTGAEIFTTGLAGAACLETRGSTLTGLDWTLVERASGLEVALAAGAGAFLSAALASRLRSTTGSAAAAPLLGSVLYTATGTALTSPFFAGTALTIFG